MADSRGCGGRRDSAAPLNTFLWPSMHHSAMNGHKRDCSLLGISHVILWNNVAHAASPNLIGNRNIEEILRKKGVDVTQGTTTFVE